MMKVLAICFTSMLTLAVGSPLAAAAAGPRDGTFWMPPQRSTSAPMVDWVFYFVFWIALFFFVLIVGLTIVFLFRFVRKRGAEAEGAPSHNLSLELTWSLIPTLLVGVLFYVGFKAFMDLSTPPADSYEVLVTGQKWKWLFQYPNGTVAADLHVPVDVPVRLVMTSEDVIHSLFIPDFRLKRDAVPGRYTKAWFQATDVGSYDVYCAEYCGKSHSDMLAKVIVQSQGEFDAWLEAESSFVDRMPPAEAGERLYRQRGCQQCHSLDGTVGTGPTFKGLFGEKAVLLRGETAVVDEDYLRESILEPNNKIVAGYGPVMPTFKGRLKDKEITALIEFIKSREH